MAIRVQNLHKRYRIRSEVEQPLTVRSTVTYMLMQPVHNFRYLRGLIKFESHEEDGSDIVWALRDVSFDVPQGEVLGIIGKNGSGKSTLMKILSGIARPTRGQVEIRGRVSSLIGVGAGFNLELSGYENIFLNGIMVGMHYNEVKRKIDEIIAFSEIEKFIYTPVKRYSTGMRVRLGFAVALHLQPDILILDEALAAGDVAFREKCLRKLQHAVQDGRTVLIVTHMLPMLPRIATRCLWMANGGIVADGTAQDVVKQFLQDDGIPLN